MILSFSLGLLAVAESALHAILHGQKLGWVFELVRLQWQEPFLQPADESWPEWSEGDVKDYKADEREVGRERK